MTCEASGYGIPIFTYDTGGLSNYVINGVNGFRLNTNSNGEDFAKCIYNSIEERKLGVLSEGGLRLYKERLNWDVFSQRVCQLLKLC